MFVITGLRIGGAQNALFNLLDGGLADMLEVHIVSLKRETEIGARYRESEYPTTYLEIENLWSLLLGLWRLKTLIKVFKPQVIQGWMYHGNLAATLAVILSGSRAALIWNIRQSLADVKKEKLGTRSVIRICQLLSSLPNAILNNSNTSVSQHVKIGFKSSGFKVIPNGIDTARFSPSKSQRKQWREKVGIMEDEFVVGHLARSHPMKDHRLFVDSANIVATRFPSVKFVMAGSGVVTGSSLLECCSQSERNRFLLLGEQTDVPGICNMIDLFCLSSAWGEGFPNVVGEAMATECVCVVTDVGDSNYLVDDTGVVVSPGDSQAMSDAIISIIELKASERSQLGQKARARIVEEFELSKIVNCYYKLYVRFSL
jgi:glycosyltransferase involved in cell wall biosynthesis